MQLNLKGKVVIVTGGTQGIGRAIVEGFLVEGAAVHFCARSKTSVVATKEALLPLAAANTGTINGWVVDISQPSQIADWITQLTSETRRIDVVVSNVSSISLANDNAAWNSAFNVDIMGTVTLIEKCLPFLEESKGNIVTISSVSGRDIDFTAPSPYGAFKAALIHYMAQLAHTLAPKGIRANTVSPGNIYVEDGVWGNTEKTNPEFFAEQLAKNVSGRMGKASEIADAVVWVASERASFVSGSNLVVDGSLCTGVQF